jgi:hypothetical protein
VIPVVDGHNDALLRVRSSGRSRSRAPEEDPGAILHFEGAEPIDPQLENLGRSV